MPFEQLAPKHEDLSVPKRYIEAETLRREVASN